MNQEKKTRINAGDKRKCADGALLASVKLGWHVFEQR